MNSAVRHLPVASGIAPDEFRGAMRHLTGGVSVITAGRGSEISGMTVTSVSSLSVEPASLIEHTVGRIESVLNAIGMGYIRAGAGMSGYPFA